MSQYPAVVRRYAAIMRDYDRYTKGSQYANEFLGGEQSEPMAKTRFHATYLDYYEAQIEGIPEHRRDLQNLMTGFRNRTHPNPLWRAATPLKANADAIEYALEQSGAETPQVASNEAYQEHLAHYLQTHHGFSIDHFSHDMPPRDRDYMVFQLLEDYRADQHENATEDFIHFLERQSALEPAVQHAYPAGIVAYLESPASAHSQASDTPSIQAGPEFATQVSGNAHGVASSTQVARDRDPESPSSRGLRIWDTLRRAVQTMAVSVASASLILGSSPQDAQAHKAGTPSHEGAVASEASVDRMATMSAPAQRMHAHIQEQIAAEQPVSPRAANQERAALTMPSGDQVHFQDDHQARRFVHQQLKVDLSDSQIQSMLTGQGEALDAAQVAQLQQSFDRERNAGAIPEAAISPASPESDLDHQMAAA